MKTPYFMIDEDKLDRQLDQMKSAFVTYWNNAIIGYSYKTNSLTWIIDWFRKKDCYAEVVSDDEYHLGKLVGVESNRFIYNGPIKSRESMKEALENGCYVNIDSWREIEWLGDLDPAGDYKLGLRVNFDIEACCPGHSSYPDGGGRFGFCYENGMLKKALDAIAEKGFSVNGLHLHISSKTRDIAVYEAIAEMACRVRREYDLKLSFVDIGGGFFGGMENKPEFPDYLPAIVSILKKEFSPETTTLIVEPGMALVGPCLSYVTSVIDVKDTTYGRFVITDGSRTAIDPTMSKSSYFYRTETCKSNVHPRQVICGYTCMEHDRMFVMEHDQELSEGDRIFYDRVGAYTMCLAPLFIQYYPAVYVRKEGQIHVVRERWQPEDIVGCRCTIDT